MLYSFFTLSVLSPTRRRAFLIAVIAHLVILGGAAWGLFRMAPGEGRAFLGAVLLSAGIAEGGILLGWRLTQLPKSQALEFLLVSPLRPHWFFLAEATVGLARLALVTLAGLPALVFLAETGHLGYHDLPVLLLMPFTWGAVTGLGLIVWAYEPTWLRRRCERVLMGCILVYLTLGLLAGENLRLWVAWLPGGGRWFLGGFHAFHAFNPFGILRTWMHEGPAAIWPAALGLEAATLLVVGVLVARSAGRLQGHFRDRHYRPVLGPERGSRGLIGDTPLSWWAVRRVTEYSGRINLWLAGGFGLLYSAYVLAGPHWPTWMGRQAFMMFDGMGGIPVLTTALVLLASVPSAFQYGLWDSSAQDRCRRLELLLLTELDGQDYWNAAAAAAWKRGKGYLYVAGMLWLTGLVAGRLDAVQLTAALLASAALLGLYFTVGFWAFTRGAQANGLGTLLTIGLPTLTFVGFQLGWTRLTMLLPPGAVYGAMASPTSAWTPVGPLLALAVTLWLAARTRGACEGELRRWYDSHHGAKVLE